MEALTPKEEDIVLEEQKEATRNKLKFFREKLEEIQDNTQLVSIYISPVLKLEDAKIIYIGRDYVEVLNETRMSNYPDKVIIPIFNIISIRVRV